MNAISIKILDSIKKIKIVLGFIVFAFVLVWITGAGAGMMYLFHEESTPTIFLKILCPMCAIAYIVFWLIALKDAKHDDPGCGLSGIILACVFLIISPFIYLVSLWIPCRVFFSELFQKFFMPQKGIEIMLSSNKNILTSVLIIISFYVCVGILLQMAVWLFANILRKIRS